MSYARRILLLVPLCIPSPASAGSVTLAAEKDATIYSEAGDLANGAGDFIFAGQNAMGQNRRSPIQFAIFANIPAGSTITSVQLLVRMNMTIAGPTNVELHRLLASWSEGLTDAPGGEGAGGLAIPGDATWVYRTINTLTWTSLGGDFSPTVSAATSVDQVTVYTFGSSAQLVADVQSMLDNPGSNAGWILIGDESQLATAKRFESRTNPIAANRPMLVVDFTPPCPAPVSYCVAAPNSAGPGALLASQGSTSVAANTFMLTVTGCPPRTWGQFFFGDLQQQVPFGNGFLCVDGSLFRLGVIHLDPLGQGNLLLDFASGTATHITAGSTWNFQLKYRNPLAGGAGFNLSDGLSAMFCP